MIQPSTPTGRIARTLPTALADLAGAAPDFELFRLYRGAALNVGEWDRQSTWTADGIRAHGIETHDRVLLWTTAGDWPQYAIAYIGVLRAGAVVVTCDIADGEEELRRRCEIAKPTLVIATSPGHLPTSQTIPTVMLDALKHAGAARSDNRVTGPEPGWLAELVFTSGSTGLSKPVACTHANLATMLPDDEPSFEGIERGPFFLHSTRVGTNASQRLFAMAAGGRKMTFLSLARFSPEVFVECIRKHGPEVVALFPHTAKLLLREARDEQFDDVRWVSIGSTPVAEPLFDELATVFPNAQIINMYGLTEAGAARVQRSRDEGTSGSVGRALPGTRFEIRDTNGECVPPGTPGEVWLAVDGPPRWYYGDPNLTAEVFRGGWIRTGDLGFVDFDGYLTIVGRTKDIFVKSGVKISALEIEQAAEAVTGVFAAAAISRRDVVTGERVILIIEVEDDLVPGSVAEEVRARLASTLPAFKRPAELVSVDALPRNTMGKVDKVRLRELYGLAPPPAAAVGTLESDWEHTVLASVRRVVGEEVERDTDLFEFGVDSLTGLEIMAALGDAIGVELPATLVFEHPRVDELIDALAAEVRPNLDAGESDLEA